MSDKQQGTAQATRQTMLNHYGNEIHHKHDKRHCPYRLHNPSHHREIIIQESEEHSNNHHTGLVKLINMKKFRKQLAKRMIH